MKLQIDQHLSRSALLGQSSVEYVVVCAALSFALGIGMWNDNSVLKELIDAFGTSYQKIAFALSLPI